ncbi:MAG TPA: pseudouridine synthase [Nitrospiria bacterium]
MQERLQKIIARAGITSRRKAEDLIRTGCVTVNGKVITELGSKADFKKDHIKVSGRLIRPNPAPVYLILHKPRGVVSTLSDPMKRKTVKDLIERVPWRVFPVGRLDFDSEGLMLFTNDGDLFHKLLHPGFKVPKTYHVKVKGLLENAEIRRLEEGVSIVGKKTLPCRIRKMTRVEKNSWLEVTLHEGRKRQIRLMIEKTRHRVLKLKRVRIGNLQLGNLPPGEFRFLNPPEVRALKALAARSEKKAPAAGRRKAVGE